MKFSPEDVRLKNIECYNRRECTLLWLRVANGVYYKTGNEVLAIRAANKHAKKWLEDNGPQQLKLWNANPFKKITLYHGTLSKNLSVIKRKGLLPSAGWGGGNTEGVYLSGSIEGAEYWAKLAFLRDRDEKLEINYFDRKYGDKKKQYLVILRVEIPIDEINNLKIDLEQTEDVGFEGDEDDWEASLKEIGDVMYDGIIPSSWLKEMSVNPDSGDEILRSLERLVLAGDEAAHDKLHLERARRELPVYNHDCDKCIFLKSIRINLVGGAVCFRDETGSLDPYQSPSLPINIITDVDLYICKSSTSRSKRNNSIVVRYGCENASYYSRDREMIAPLLNRFPPMDRSGIIKNMNFAIVIALRLAREKGL